MVEGWNIAFKNEISRFNFIVNPVDGGTINPTLHYPRTHYSAKASLRAQYSIILGRRRMSEAN